MLAVRAGPESKESRQRGYSTYMNKYSSLSNQVSSGDEPRMGTEKQARYLPSIIHHLRKEKKLQLAAKNNRYYQDYVINRD